MKHALVLVVAAAVGWFTVGCEEQKTLQTGLKSSGPSACHRGHRGKCGGHDKRLLAKYDADKDGKLDDAERAKAKADCKKRHDKYVKKYDKNKDGKLDAEERKAAHDARKKCSHHGKCHCKRGGYHGKCGDFRNKLLAKYDADKDGKLDDKEKAAMHKAWREKWELARYDKNKDGKLDKAELAARDKARAEREKRHEAFIKKYDKNKDGKLDDKEKAAMHKAWREKWELARYDKNKDGKLDAEERKAIKTKCAKKHKEGKKDK